MTDSRPAGAACALEAGWRTLTARTALSRIPIRYFVSMVFMGCLLSEHDATSAFIERLF
jgi:hypothetical protein